jgi:phosphoribosylanthranilate isomerase
MSNKKLHIKVCGMRDLENIKQLVQLPIDYIGYIFYSKSKRYVGEKPNQTIFSSVPERIQKVGVFVNEKPEVVLETITTFKIQAVQLHGNETPEYCSNIKQEGATVIKAFAVGNDFNNSMLKAYESGVDFFLFDTATSTYGGSGKKFNWEVLQNIKIEKPYFLSGGIGPDDVKNVNQIKHPNLYAIDLNSKFEIEPALKNVEELKNFISNLNKEET